jgi:hypothetical protein
MLQNFSLFTQGFLPTETNLPAVVPIIHYLKDSHLHFVEILQYETKMDALGFFFN